MSSNHPAHSSGSCAQPRICQARRRRLQIPLDEGLIGAGARRVDVLALDGALASLFKFDSRKARVVELRYFGGLSVAETAEVLGISPETAKRDWKMAKAWLFGELSGKRDRTSP